jgi:hypothetical protein
MLVITIDLVPGGYQPNRRTIGSMRIANVSNLADISDYLVDVYGKREPADEFASPDRILQGERARPPAGRVDPAGKGRGGG